MIWLTAVIVVTSANAQEVSSRLNRSKDDLSFATDHLVILVTGKRIAAVTRNVFPLPNRDQ